MPDHRDALVPPPPQDEARKRWTRPIVREWDGMTETTSDVFTSSKDTTAEDEGTYSYMNTNAS